MTEPTGRGDGRTEQARGTSHEERRHWGASRRRTADGDTFGALGLPARADLTDDDVRAAWRRLAAATHPDRADGGDPDRFAAAAAAYTVLRTRSGRGEALADLTAPTPPPRPPRPARSAARSRPAGNTPPPQQPRPADRTPPPQQPRPPGNTPPPQQPRPAGHTPSPRQSRPAGRAGLWAGRLLARIRRGRPARLLLRIAIAAAVSAGAVAVAGGQPATPAVIVGAVTWLLLTVRRDLAPPR